MVVPNLQIQESRKRIEGLTWWVGYWNCNAQTTSASEKVEDTQWHDVVVWGKTADIVANYLVKGKQVAVEAKLPHRLYEAKEGEKRYITEVRCNELLMLGK